MSKKIILNLVENLDKRLLSLLESYDFFVTESLELDQYINVKYILVEKGQDVKALFETYECDVNNIVFIMLGRPDNLKEFLSFNGRLYLIDSNFEGVDEKILKNFLKESSSIHFSDIYGEKFDKFYNLEITDTKNIGYYSDEMSSFYRENYFDDITIRACLDNLLIYLSYLKNTNFIDLPFSLDAGKSNEECSLSIAFNAPRYYFEYLIESFGDYSLGEPFSYTLATIEKLTQKFEISYFKEAKKVVFYMGWSKDKASKLLSLNNIVTKQQETRDVEQFIRVLNNTDAPASQVSTISTLVAEDEFLNKLSSKDDVDIIATKVLGDYQESTDVYVTDLSDEELEKTIVSDSKDELDEQQIKLKASQVKDKITKVKESICEDEESKKIIGGSLAQEVAQRVIGGLEEDDFSQVVKAFDEEEDEFKQFIKNELEEDDDSVEVISGIIDKVIEEEARISGTDKIDRDKVAHKIQSTLEEKGLMNAKVSSMLNNDSRGVLGSRISSFSGTKAELRSLFKNRPQDNAEFLAKLTKTLDQAIDITSIESSDMQSLENDIQNILCESLNLDSNSINIKGSSQKVVNSFMAKKLDSLDDSTFNVSVKEKELEKVIKEQKAQKVELERKIEKLEQDLYASEKLNKVVDRVNNNTDLSSLDAQTEEFGSDEIDDDLLVAVDNAQDLSDAHSSQIKELVSQKKALQAQLISLQVESKKSKVVTAQIESGYQTEIKKLSKQLQLEELKTHKIQDSLDKSKEVSDIELDKMKKHVEKVNSVVLDEAKKKSQVQMSKLEKENETLAKSIKILKEKIEELNSSNATDSSKAQLYKLQSENMQLVRSTAQLENKFKSQEKNMKSMEKRLQKSKEQEGRLRAKASMMKTSVKKLEDELRKSKHDQTQIDNKGNKSNDELVKKVERKFQVEKDALAMQIRGLQRQLQKYKDQASSNATKSSHGSSKKNESALERKLQANLKKVQVELNKSRNEIVESKKLYMKFKNENNGLKRELEALKKKTKKAA
ncbi:MAG: hypothetical protein N4A33_11295 [Bacteriovoracaceae bacterium]|nr:hypothetical protein [Bacteriovoracaceae bacterium]